MACHLSDVCKRNKVKRQFIALTVIILLYCLPGLSFGEGVVVSWDPNAEEDLMGYKIYYGTSPRNYTTVIDVGNVSEYVFDSLSKGLTYFFAVSAYDTVYNESDYSAEVSITLSDSSQLPVLAPQIIDVVLITSQTIKVYFSQEMKETSVTNMANYSISHDIQIVSITVDSMLMFVEITTTSHQIGTNYSLTIQSVENSSGVPLQQAYQKNYQFRDTISPYVEKVELISLSTIKIFFNEKLYPGSIKGPENFSIAPFTEIYSLDIDTSFKIITLHTQNHQYAIQYNMEIKDLGDPSQNFVPVNYRIIYEFSKPAVIDSISQSNYDSAVLSVNDRYYIDRDFRLKNLPDELLSLTWVRTGNDDKFSTGENFLSFFVDDSIVVYLGYDERILEIPGWLQNWSITDLVIIDDQNISFRCYSKPFLSEKIVIGGNYGSDQSNMYIVLVKNFNTIIKDPDQPKPDADDGVVLQDFELLQNYPNPFNPFTEIPFIANSQDHVTLTIFDMLGKVVREFEIDIVSTGLYQVTWDATCKDGRPAGNGVYIYRLQTSNFQATQKMMLLR